MLRTAHAAIAAAILYCLFVLIWAFPAHAANVPCGPWEAMLRAGQPPEGRRAFLA